MEERGVVEKPKAEMVKKVEPEKPKSEAPKAKNDNVKKPNSFELSNKIAKIEGEIAALEAQKTNLEQELAKPEVYGNSTQLAKVQGQYEETKTQLSGKEAEWEQLVEMLESK